MPFKTAKVLSSIGRNRVTKFFLKNRNTHYGVYNINMDLREYIYWKYFNCKVLSSIPPRLMISLNQVSTKETSKECGKRKYFTTVFDWTFDILSISNFQMQSRSYKCTSFVLHFDENKGNCVLSMRKIIQ